MAEMLITVAIIVILCGFGFVAVIAHQRNLKRMEMDETAQEIFIAAQNHLTAAEANGQWDSFLKKTKSDAGKAARGTGLGYTPSDYSATGDPNQGSREFYAITTESAQEVQQGAMELILPEGSIDETLRGNHFYVEYDAASGTVYGVFYTDSDHEITADDAQKVSRSDPNARRDYTVDGKRTIIGYYGGALGELKNPKDLYAPAVAVRNAESLVLYVVDKNYNRPVSSETGAANFQTRLLLTIEGETSGEKAEKEIDPATLGSLTDSFSTAVLADDSKKDFEVEVPSGADSSTTKQVKAKYYAIVLDSIVREDGHFAELFPELIPGENLRITVTLHSDAGGEDVSETVRVNSLFNSIKTEKKFFGLVEDKTVVTVSNPRHLENLSTEVSGTDFESKQLKKNVTVDSVSIVRDLFWDDDPAAEEEQEKQGETKEKVTPFLTAIDSAKGMDTLFGYYAGGRTAIAKDSVQVYPYAGASAGTKTGAATEGTGTNGSAERISLGACYGITNPAIKKVEGNNHILAAFRFEGKEEAALINEAGEELNIRNLRIMDATSAVTGEKTGTGSSEVVPTAAILIANAKSGEIKNIAVRWLEGSGTKTGANQTVKVGGSEPAASDLQGCRVYSAKGIASALIGTVDAANGTKPEFTITNTTVKTVASSTDKDTAHLGVEGETAAVLIGEVKGGTVTLDNSKAESDEKKSTVTVEGTLALIADRGEENNQIAGGLIGSIVQDENVTIKELDVTAAAMKVQAAKDGSASAGTQGAGGLVGAVSGGTETNLEEVNLTTKELTVSSEKSAGGLVGETASQNTLNVEKVNLSANALEVTGKQAAGGAIGNAAAGTVTLKEINVLTAKAAGDNGEVGQDQSGTEKVYGIRVTAVNGKAGGLVGAAENGVKGLAIESSAVSGSGTADQIEAGSSAGGLIGDTRAEATSVAGSMASVYVQSEGNGGTTNGTSSTDGAGGLIGSASGNVTISNSYSGGRTKKADNPDRKEGDPADERARYMGSTTGQGRFNVWLVSGGGAAGGLVGKYTGGSLVLSDAYSTSSVAVSYISNAKIGGLVGEADSLNASNTYCTGRVYFTSGTSNGAMKDEPNDTSNIGTYAGAVGNFSGNGNYYLEGLKGVAKGSIGTLNGSKNPTGIDEKILAGANYYDNNCPLKSGVSGSQKTYTYDSSLAGQSYPYKTVNISFAKPLYDPATGEKVENAEQDGNQNESKYAQIGDWEIPEEESTEGTYGLIYYERIWDGTTNSLDPTFYYHGYMLESGDTAESATYKEIQSQKPFVTAKDHYVAESGYLLLVKDNMKKDMYVWIGQHNKSEGVKGWGQIQKSIESLDLYNWDADGKRQFRGYDAYDVSLSIGEYSDKTWLFTPSGNDFGGLLAIRKKKGENNWEEPTAAFTYIPFFADALKAAEKGQLQSVSKSAAENEPQAILRSADQMKYFFAFENAVSNNGYLCQSDSKRIIEQQLDITFNQNKVTFTKNGNAATDDAYQSPTLSQVGWANAVYRCALRPNAENDHDFYVLDGLSSELITTVYGTVCDFQITDMKAPYFVQTVSGSSANIRAVTITDAQFGKGETYTEATPGGFAKETVDGQIEDCHIINASIYGNGFIESTTNGGTIRNCTIVNATIWGNGFVKTNNASIENCGIYANPGLYDRESTKNYKPYSSTHGTYDYVSIGIAPGGTKSSENVAGFVQEENGWNRQITGCYVAGTLYGDGNVAGFIGNVKDGLNVENCYANVVIEAGGDVSGFAREIDNDGSQIIRCHALGMIKSNGTASGAVSEIKKGKVESVYQAFWKVDAKQWYPFYKTQSNGTVQNNYYLADCEINADDSELVDYGQKVKALSYQQLCGLQKGATSTTIYDQYIHDKDTPYPYPMPADQVAYGDWSHQDPGKVTLLYYERKGTNYYFHGYSTADGENYREEKTSGAGLENGLLASANTTIDEDGYVLILEKNAGWSAFGRADNTGAVSSEVKLEKNSVFEKASTDLMTALRGAGFTAENDRMYSFSMDKYLSYQDKDTTKQFAPWQTLTQESGGVGLTIYTTKGKVPTAKFSFQPFFADTVTVPEVKQENATSSEKTLSFQTTRHSGSDYDYRIRTLRQLKALSNWDGQRFSAVADQQNLKDNFDKDASKRYSYLSTSNEQYENHLTIRQDLDIDVDGTEINFDCLDGTYIGRKYGDSSDEPVNLKKIAYDFADVVAPSGSIQSLIVLDANLTGTATTAASGNEVAHGGRREFVEYNYGTISNIAVKNSTLGSAGLVYQNGNLPENVLKEETIRPYGNKSDMEPYVQEKNARACQYKTRIEYKRTTDIHDGTISSCTIEDSTIGGAGMVWSNQGGIVQNSRVTKCDVKYSGFAEKNQAVQVNSPHYKYLYEYWYNRWNWTDTTEKVPDSIIQRYGWPTESTEGTVSVTVDSVIKNCQVIDCKVKTNGFVGENSVNTQGSAGSTQGSSGKAQIQNCQVYGTTSYGDLVVGNDSGTAGVADVAGFAGTNGQGAEITNCSVTGTVKGLSNVAGFVRSNAGTITGSYANAFVSCSADTNTNISGFALTNAGTIEKSHSLGTLKNTGSAGSNKQASGFVTRNADGDNRGTIKNSYAAVWEIDVEGTGSNYLPFGNNEGTYTNCYAMKLQKYVDYGGSYRATSASAECVSGEDLKNLCDTELGTVAADGKTAPYLQELKSEKYPFPCGSDIMNYGNWELTDAAATARTVTLDAGTRAAFSEDVALSLSRDTAVMAASDGSTDQTQGADGESSSTISISDENRQKVQVELGEDEEQLDLSELVPERKGWKLLGWLITAPSELTASTEKTTVSNIVTKITKVSDGSQKTEQADAESTENASEGAGVSEESEETKVTYQLETGTKSYHFAPDAVITVTEDMTLSAVWVPDDDTIAKAKDGTLRMDENGNILDEEDAVDSANTAGTTAADAATSGTSGTDDASTAASGTDKAASDEGNGTADTDPDGAGSSASAGSTGTSDSDSGSNDGEEGSTEANTGSSREDAATDSGSTTVQANADSSAAVTESDAVTE